MQMKNSTVLIVDDDKALLKVMKKFFEKRGFRVFGADNGEKALKIFTKEDIDLIISDLKMPKMNGDTLFAEVREKQPTIPFFLYTGYLEHTSIPILEKMGISGVLEKPLTLDEVLDAVKDSLPETTANIVS